MGNVVITIEADDMSERKLDSLVKRLGNVERQGQRTGASYDRMARGVQLASQGFERGFQIMTRLDLVQITLQQSTDRVRQAQERYTEAVKEHGAGSKEAVEAARELTRAQQDLQKAQLRARISMVLIAGDLVTIAATLPKAVKGLQALAVSMRAAGAAAVGLKVALAATGIGLAAVAITGLMGVMDRFGPKAGSTATSIGEIDKQLKELRETDNQIRGALLTGLTLGGKKSPIEKENELLAARRRLIDENRAAADASRQAFIAGEERRSLINAGNLQDLKDERVLLEERIEASREWLTHNIRAEDRTRTMERLADDLADLEEVNTALQSIESQASKTFGALNSGLEMFGVNLNRFSIDSRQAFLEAAGVSKELADQVFEAARAEEKLAMEAIRANPALRAQAHVTAEKEETTAELVARLLSLGFTEDDIRTRLDLATNSLLSQEEATRRAAQAAEDFGGSQGGIIDQTQWADSLRGPLAGMAGSSSGLEDFIRQGTDIFRQSQAPSPLQAAPQAMSTNMTVHQNFGAGLAAGFMGAFEIGQQAFTGLRRAINVPFRRIATRGGT